MELGFPRSARESCRSIGVGGCPYHRNVNEDRTEHWCEACGAREMLTPDEGFDAGWDFPPKMGILGVVSPRPCSNCSITKTLWWARTVAKKDIGTITPQQRRVLARTLNEVHD